MRLASVRLASVLGSETTIVGADVDEGFVQPRPDLLLDGAMVIEKDQWRW